MSRILSEKEVSEKMKDGKISPKDFAMSAPQTTDPMKTILQELKYLTAAVRDLQTAYAKSAENQYAVLRLLVENLKKGQDKKGCSMSVIRDKDGKICSVKMDKE